MQCRFKKQLDLKVSQNNKSFYLNFMLHVSNYIKDLITDYPFESQNISISCGNEISLECNSIYDFKENFIDSMEIKSFEFTLVLSKTEFFNNVTSIYFYFDSVKPNDVFLKTITVSSTSQVLINDISFAIQNEIPTLFLNEKDIGRTIIPVEITSTSNVPVEITTSPDERNYSSNTTKSSRKFTTKLTVIGWVATAALSVIAGLLLGKFT